MSIPINPNQALKNSEHLNSDINSDETPAHTTNKILNVNINFDDLREELDKVTPLPPSYLKNPANVNGNMQIRLTEKPFKISVNPHEFANTSPKKKTKLQPLFSEGQAQIPS